MIHIQPPRLLKAWSMIAHPPEGPTAFRNPPPQTFRPAQEPDIPAFAHNGRGDIVPGEFDSSQGPLAYKTQHGNFYHGIDSLAVSLANFFKMHGKDVDPIAVINKAIGNFNNSHSHGQHHELPPFDNMAWRKIRANTLPQGTTAKDAEGNEQTNRQSRTHNRTLITALTNKNADQTPFGRFIESYYIPFNQNLFHILQDMGFEDRQIKGSLKSGVTYPYVYSNHTAPEGWVYSNKGEHPETYTSDMMGRAKPGYFPDQESVHTWSTVHHLPDVFFYPSQKNENKDIMSGGGAPTKLVAAAHAMIDQAIEQGGMESIPDVPVTLNTGTLGAPNMIQRPLHEILGNKDLKEALVKDMAHVPAMMYLFGRSYQGNFKKLYNHMMDKYGGGEEALSVEEHGKYLTGGEKGGQGLHKNAARLLALARASGEGSEEGRSKMGEHGVSSDELEAANLPYSEQRLGQVDRFRNVIEALANHQAEARGHPVQMGLGDIPSSPMPSQMIHGYPQQDETGAYPEPILDDHMQAYLHSIDDFAPNGQQMDEGQPSLSQPKETPQTLPPVATHVPVRSPEQTSVETPPVEGERPVVSPRFQDVRHQISDFSPSQFREMLQIAGASRPQSITDAPLSELEARSQQALSDPRQRLLTDYMKSEDAHLPLMDKLMKALERMQYHEAQMDNDVVPHLTNTLNSPLNLAKYVGLTSSEVNAINHTMGDWYDIAKSYNVEPKVVKVIKMNLR